MAGMATGAAFGDVDFAPVLGAAGGARKPCAAHQMPVFCGFVWSAARRRAISITAELQEC
jgi:hypothetical protein